MGGQFLGFLNLEIKRKGFKEFFSRFKRVFKVERVFSKFKPLICFPNFFKKNWGNFFLYFKFWANNSYFGRKEKAFGGAKKGFNSLIIKGGLGKKGRD